MHSLTFRSVKHLTVRNLPPHLSRALQKEVRRRGLSLNETVKLLLSRELGIAADESTDNGLRKYAGKWSQEEFEEFVSNTAEFEKIDEDVWR